MKTWWLISLLVVSSFSYASELNLLDSDIQAEQSVKQIIKNVTTIPPVENITITVFANSIGGPVKKLTTNSCITAVEFIKPLVGNKPMTIMDGGYTLEIEQNEKKFNLSSHQQTLFSWIEHCEKLK